MLTILCFQSCDDYVLYGECDLGHFQKYGKPINFQELLNHYNDNCGPPMGVSNNQDLQDGAPVFIFKTLKVIFSFRF